MIKDEDFFFYQNMDLLISHPVSQQTKTSIDFWGKISKKHVCSENELHP